MNYKLIQYIQERNPSVPAIPFKIFPPAEKDRSLTRETRLWHKILEKQSFTDLYTGENFTSESFEKYGKFTLDHFIPWSFVLHNEIWNLYPMFGKLNSSKNNKLPDKQKYLNEYCEKQYHAFTAIKTISGFQVLKDQYLNIKSDIFEIGEDDRGHDAFVEAMQESIEPLYQLAVHQGYGTWYYI